MENKYGVMFMNIDYKIDINTKKSYSNMIDQTQLSYP